MWSQHSVYWQVMTLPGDVPICFFLECRHDDFDTFTSTRKCSVVAAPSLANSVTARVHRKTWSDNDVRLGEAVKAKIFAAVCIPP